MKSYSVIFLILLTSCTMFKTEYTKDEIIIQNGLFYSKEGELITGNIVYETEDQKIIQTLKEGKVTKADIFRKNEGIFIKKQSFEYSPSMGSRHYYDNGALKVEKINGSVMYYKNTGNPLLSVQWPINTHPKEFEGVKFTCFSQDGVPKNVDKNKKETFIKNYFEKVALLEFEEEVNLDDSCEAYTVTE